MAKSTVISIENSFEHSESSSDFNDYKSAASSSHSPSTRYTTPASTSASVSSKQSASRLTASATTNSPPAKPGSSSRKHRSNPTDQDSHDYHHRSSRTSDAEKEGPAISNGTSTTVTMKQTLSRSTKSHVKFSTTPAPSRAPPPAISPTISTSTYVPDGMVDTTTTTYHSYQSNLASRIEPYTVMPSMHVTSSHSQTQAQINQSKFQSFGHVPTTATGVSIPNSPPSSGSHAITGPMHHPKFWFHDGSIVLQVQTKLFRVHQTILANHSEIFADLFDIPQPPAQEEGGEGCTAVEGCHVIVLQDDENDFEDLLSAVYNPSYFDLLPPNAPLDDLLDFISGILRLSTKYLIRNLRMRCIGLLKLKFPTTFEEYNAKASGRQTATGGGVHVLNGRPSMANLRARGQSADGEEQTNGQVQSYSQERYKSDSIMRAISLAHETNVLTVLPYAYYCVARLSLRRLMKNGEQRAAKAAAKKRSSEGASGGKGGGHGGDSESDSEDSSPNQTPSSEDKAKTAREAELSWKMKCVCLVGRERLRWAEMSVSHSFLMLFERSPECRGGPIAGSNGLNGGLASNTASSSSLAALLAAHSSHAHGNNHSGVNSTARLASLLASLPSLSSTTTLSAFSPCSHTRGPQAEWNLISSAKAPNPLRQYTRWERLGLCRECMEWSQDVHERGRREVWERLPSFFELGTWDALDKGEARG